MMILRWVIIAIVVGIVILSLVIGAAVNLRANSLAERKPVTLEERENGVIHCNIWKLRDINHS